ncbi:MAG: SDR family NAD(P)-dependent oxidoreductase [Ruminococcaceae bacterium]|nr:SDR family NAD(P)-dependent oxidoreductase [Oscillospiraceae bacterium]
MRYQEWYQKNARSQEGRVAVVTGANSGIGFFAARGLAYLGAEVVLACRNEGRATAACERIRAEFPSARVSYMPVDLASFASIDAFAANLAARYPKIDVFLHCAGVYYPRTTRTVDGLPMTEGVNYVGTVRLTEAVLSLLDATGRMVFTTSLTDRFGKDKRGENEGEGYAAYARSKHLLSAFVVQKARERGENQPLFAATHPGITATDLLSPDKTSHKPLFSRLGHAFLYVFTHSPEKAALTAILATAGNIENGACIGPCGLFGISGFPHRTRFCRQVLRRASRVLPK